ncbi:MAG: penicillin acylase family protein, partial [Mycobacteriales bacterium]
MAAPLAVVAPATAAIPNDRPSEGMATVPSFQPGREGFHSVLGYCEGETTSAADLALFVGAGKVPPAFVNQAALYNAVIAGRPRDNGDLARYYKDSSFSVPTGADIGSVDPPIDGVTVIRDRRFNVPHIYASTRPAGMYAAGYVSAQDRLFLMDVLRRTAEGELSGLLGASAVGGDSNQIGQFDLSPAELTREVTAVAKSQGRLGRQALADIRSYVAGINGYITATRTNPTMLPAEYIALGATPRPWNVADTAAEAYLLIAQFTVAGDGEQFQSQILSGLQKRLGKHHGRQVFDD